MSLEIESRLIDLVRETLALGADESISCRQLLFYDLGFTSMDLLDLLFRIEREFQVSIPEGTLYRFARGDLDDGAFCEAGHLTIEGRRRLMALLDDSPPEIFHERIHAQTLHRYCTLGAFVRVVDALRQPE
jgi:acyl carrier protein